MERGELMANTRERWEKETGLKAKMPALALLLANRERGILVIVICFVLIVAIGFS